MLQPLVVSTNSLASDEPGDVVFSVHSYISLVLEEGGSPADLHPDALGLRAITVLDEEVLNGGFSQFVYNTRWDEENNALIDATLERLGASDHLTYFRARRALVNSPAMSGALDDFFASDYIGADAFRDSVDDDAYFAIEPDLTTLIATWVRAHPDAVPHSIDEMFARAESLVGHPIDREG